MRKSNAVEASKEKEEKPHKSFLCIDKKENIIENQKTIS
jgi:hypothetical protein